MTSEFILTILERHQGKIPLERQYFPYRCLVLRLSVSIVDGKDLRCDVNTNLMNKLLLSSIKNLGECHQPYNLRYFKIPFEISLYDTCVDISSKSWNVTVIVSLNWFDALVLYINFSPKLFLKEGSISPFFWVHPTCFKARYFSKLLILNNITFEERHIFLKWLQSIPIFVSF